MSTNGTAGSHLAFSGEMVFQASEGRWPRICARPSFQRQRRAGETGWWNHVL
jgi:hypothetical protein